MTNNTDGANLESGCLPTAWTDERDAVGGCGPAFRVHFFNAGLIVVRQSGRTHFEKPFLYLLVGEERAMLVDTGAPGVEVGAEVRRLLGFGRDARATRPLIVTHTHGHGDHVAGDGQFAGMPDTTLVGTSIVDVSKFFGIERWPDDVGSIDLGGRLVDVVPIPGHEAASVAFYDRRTGILLSGDLLYPGRLYVRDAAAFLASVKRLVAFTRTRPVAHILGAHIENRRTPFLDYPEGTAFQPDEHSLELGRAHLLELDAALDAMGSGLERRALRDFTVWPLTP
ncbi:MAG TPA: MBL fold metallo-hydrolase [Vicinamibacterales bacterium]